ncbi:hypothetical protein ACFCV9_36870 [Streptomyces sp. NPDC056367]|uniref:hypothetical protein n=1 Tax=Streptomyces sp. NPDC056367 TaxID=3345797 RepID=UPI0035DC7362
MRYAYMFGFLQADGHLARGRGQKGQLAAHFYYDGCLAIAHKKANADAIQSWVRPSNMKVAPPRRRWTAREDQELLRLNDPTVAGIALDRTEQSCKMRLWRLRTGRI